MKALLRRFIEEESGQTATEYMMILSVLVLAVVSAAYAFVEPFRRGVESMSRDVKTVLGTGLVDGNGSLR